MAGQRSNLACAAGASVVVMGILASQTAFAQSRDAARAAAVPHPSTHVLPAHQDGLDARPLLEDALGRSATIRRLVAVLETSDVLVYVVLQFEIPSGSGDLHLMPTVAGTRRALIRIDVRQTIPERFKLLGHELQHAVEVASAPDVRDQAGMRRLFSRIGVLTPIGFETDAAVHAGWAAYAECFREPGRKGSEATDPARVPRR